MKVPPRYLVINPAGDLAERVASMPALMLDSIRGAIGGYAELVNIDTPGLAALVNEDGVTLGLPVNPIGTRVLAALGWPAAGIPARGIRGPVAFAHAGRHDFAGMTDAQITLITETHQRVSAA